jgi:hypothetical protein
MKKQVIAAALAALALGAASFAHAGEQEATLGVAADAATTAASLATPGLAETNPLGWATVPIRLAILQHAKTLPREEAQPLVDMTSASGWGAAANNLLVLAGASGPAAPLVGMAVAYAVWKNGETEREFWKMCAVHKQFDSHIKCEFRAWKHDEVVQVAQEMQRQNTLTVAQATTAAAQ